MDRTNLKKRPPIKLAERLWYHFLGLPKPWLHGVNHVLYIWMFPKIGVPQNGWFIMANLIKMDDLGVPLFSETSIYMIHQFILTKVTLFNHLMEGSYNAKIFTKSFRYQEIAGTEPTSKAIFWGVFFWRNLC